MQPIHSFPSTRRSTDYFAGSANQECADIGGLVLQDSAACTAACQALYSKSVDQAFAWGGSHPAGCFYNGGRCLFNTDVNQGGPSGASAVCQVSPPPPPPPTPPWAPSHLNCYINTGAAADQVCANRRGFLFESDSWQAFLYNGYNGYPDLNSQRIFTCLKALQDTAIEAPHHHSG